MTAQPNQPLAPSRPEPSRGQLHAVHVISGLKATYGGPVYSVPRLCEALSIAGVKPELLTVAELGSSPSETSAQGFNDHRYAWDHTGVPILRDIRTSSGLSRALHQIAPQTDIIHNHGLWLMPNVYSGWAAARAHRPLIVTPRGMLSPAALSFSRLKKRAFWWLLQGPALAKAACFHATSEGEYQEIRAFGIKCPVAIIPNGIDLPETGPERRHQAGRERVILSLGRIHPKKGLDRLVRAWARLEEHYPAWRLRLVGSDEVGHADELRGLVKSLGLLRVSIEGPLYGPQKSEAYEAADVFVLPTLSDNFALTVAEALASGVPVISTKGAPWSGLQREGCGWWIEQGVEPLVAALEAALTMPEETLRAMGSKGRSWMARDFSWERVARDMLDVYDWAARGAKAPASVRFD